MKKKFAFKKMVTLVFCVIFVVSTLVACKESSNDTKQSKELIISIASSLKKPMQEVGEMYEKQKKDISLNFNYASSGDLQQQIENGSPTDVFISAAQKQMKALADKGLLAPDTKKDLLENKLVLITLKTSTQIQSFEDLASDKVKQIALGEPKSVPAGQYADEVLRKIGIADKVKSKAVYGKDVTQVLSYVEQGEVDAGIVYSTDAKASDKVRIVLVAPEGSHTPIIYPIAVTKSSVNQKESKEFIDFLYSDKAKIVFEKYGFIVK